MRCPQCTLHCAEGPNERGALCPQGLALSWLRQTKHVDSDRHGAPGGQVLGRGSTRAGRPAPNAAGREGTWGGGLWVDVSVWGASHVGLGVSVPGPGDARAASRGVVRGVTEERREGRPAACPGPRPPRGASGRKGVHTCVCVCVCTHVRVRARHQ